MVQRRINSHCQQLCVSTQAAVVPRCQFDIVCCYCEVSGAAIGSNIAASLRMTDRLTLVVDDTRFVVEPDVFRQYPDTMLGR